MHSLAVNSICWLYSLSPFVGTKGSREDRRERERKRERERERKRKERRRKNNCGAVHRNFRMLRRLEESLSRKTREQSDEGANKKKKKKKKKINNKKHICDPEGPNSGLF